MPGIEDHAYLKLCAELASCWSISLAAARRKVELEAVKEGTRDIAARKLIALRMLQLAKTTDGKDKNKTVQELDRLLEALAEEDNFMIED